MGNDTPRPDHTKTTITARLSRDGNHHVVCGRPRPGGGVCGERLARLFPDRSLDQGRGNPRHTGGPIAAGPGDDYAAIWLPRETDYPGADGPLGSVYLLGWFVWSDKGHWEYSAAAKLRWAQDQAIAAGREWGWAPATAARRQEDARRRMSNRDAARQRRRFGLDQGDQSHRFDVSWYHRAVDRGAVYFVRCPKCDGINSTRFLIST